MMFERQTIEAIERLQAVPWQGVVFRHMLADFAPDRENTMGARWNPPECPAIYTSLAREICIAEANYHLDLQPVPIKAKRNVYRIQVALQKVLDLSDWTTLQSLGVAKENYDTDDYTNLQQIGGAAEWLKHDGILVPSARSPGLNRVIFPNQPSPDSYQFEILAREIL